MRLLVRGGDYCRVAGPGWADPLDPSFSRERGGRWNPPGRFAVVYLNSSMQLARAQLRTKLGRRGLEPEDLIPTAAPLLVDVRVPEDHYADVVTARGVQAAGLAPTYPLDAAGRVVPRETCRPFGVLAHREAIPGIACRPAVAKAPVGSEELTYFGRRRLKLLKRRRFEDWY